MAAGTTAIAACPEQIRVVTYNVHKCRGMDGRVRPARVVQVLREVKADIIALQEVLSIRGEAPEADQAAFLAEGLGMRYAIGENRMLRGGPYGNVVLSRFPVHAACNYDLSVRGREQRGCMRADVDLGDRCVLHVFNAHLGTAYMERRHQGRKLVSEELLRSRELSGPRVLLGDFNEWIPGLATRLLKSDLRSADIREYLRRSRTYPGLLPFVHLDHIYHDPELKMMHLTLHRSRLALIASDHLPLAADFKLP